MNDLNKPKIIISKCLLGECCRYDGKSKPNQCVVDFLSKVDTIKVCPEESAGLGVPREPISVCKINGEFRIISNINKNDHTDRINEYIEEFLDGIQFDGAILKAKSPSCGLRDTELFDENFNLLCNDSSGIFAKKLLDNYNHVILENDKNLNDRASVEKFYEKVLNNKKI